MKYKPTSSFTLAEKIDYDAEATSQWDNIVSMFDGKPLTFQQIRNGMELEYAGRGPAYRVPSERTIQQAVKDLVAEGTLIEIHPTG